MKSFAQREEGRILDESVGVRVALLEAGETAQDDPGLNLFDREHLRPAGWPATNNVMRIMFAPRGGAPTGKECLILQSFDHFTSFEFECFDPVESFNA